MSEKNNENGHGLCLENLSLQSFRQDYNLISYITCVGKCSFYRWVAARAIWSRLRTTDFWETFHGNFYFLFPFRVFVERKSTKKYFWIFFVMFDMPANTLPTSLQRLLQPIRKFNIRSLNKYTILHPLTV